MPNVSKNKRRLKAPLAANNCRTGVTTQQKYKRVDYIPIDYISAKIIDICKAEIERHLKKLDCKYYSTLTKDNLEKETYEYKSLKIIFIKTESGGSYVNFKGSLHKYWNDGIHNYNNFNHKAFKKAISQLKNDFGLTPLNLYIKALEVGVNIEPPIKSNVIINHCFAHKRKDIEQQMSSYDGKYHQVKHITYILKVYNKGLQAKLSIEILRIEIKYTNWSSYRANGIRTLENFIKSDKAPFLEDLLKKWNEVVFFDPTIKNYSTQHQYNNRLYWQALQDKSHKTYSKHRHKLRQLGKDQGENVQGQISNSIEDCILKGQGVRNYTLRKKCLITGFDISMQRVDSWLLSHTGLKHIFKTDPTKYKHLVKMYLPIKWRQSKTDIKIREIAHTIRNKYNYHERAKNSKG